MQGNDFLGENGSFNSSDGLITFYGGKLRENDFMLEDANCEKC